MFTRQAANISQALYLSGIPQASVAAAQNLIGQCRAAIEHRGPVRFDYTNPNFRLITPNIAGPLGSRPGGAPPEDFPPQDPGPLVEEVEEDPLGPPQPRDPAPEEHRQPVRPPPPGPGEGGPGVWPGVKDYFEADYIRIDRRRRTISARANDLRRHAAFPLRRNKANTIHSVDFRAFSYGETGALVAPGDANARVTLEIQDRRDFTDWQLRVHNLETVDVLTDVELSQDPLGDWQLKFTKREAYVFAPGLPSDITFTLEEVNSLTDATLGVSDLEFPATKVWVLKTESGDDAAISLGDCPT